MYVQEVRGPGGHNGDREFTTRTGIETISVDHKFLVLWDLHKLP